jgi:hypothetical protein
VALPGSVAAQYQHRAWIFGFGACLASIGFFSALGCAARWLSPVFARPRAWLWLELAMGCIIRASRRACCCGERSPQDRADIAVAGDIRRLARSGDWRYPVTGVIRP